MPEPPSGVRLRAAPPTAPPTAPLRPSSDRLRQAVFNILDHGRGTPGYLGQRVLDVFAGTGAYGLEALSRGAAFATFIERDAAALAAIRRTLAAFGEQDNAALLRLDAARLGPPPTAAGVPAALAFLDPPYAADLAAAALDALRAHGWLCVDAMAVVEVAAAAAFAPPPGFTIADERIHGAGRVVFLRPGGSEAGVATTSATTTR